MYPSNEICPWSKFNPATFSFWEERLCAWVSEPANTWSNLAYISVGISLLLYYSKIRWSPVKFFAWICILVGITSGLYHASCTFMFQCADLGSMFLVVTLMLTLNLRRIGLIKPREVYFFFWGSFITSLAVLLKYNFAGRIIFIILLTLSLAIEGYQYITKSDYKIKPLITAIVIFAVSFVFWQLDLKGLMARHDNHVFQGHALWHIVNSLSFIFLYKFYDQFAILSPRRLKLIEQGSSTAHEWLYGRLIRKRKTLDKSINNTICNNSII
ncbi:ceramidase domain-containing protein [bacterium]|nr:ceramidase domain-containing protein [bacterium]